MLNAAVRSVWIGVIRMQSNILETLKHLRSLIANSSNWLLYKNSGSIICFDAITQGACIAPRGVADAAGGAAPHASPGASPLALRAEDPMSSPLEAHQVPVRVLRRQPQSRRGAGTACNHVL